jgi:hypothetical protein
MGTVETKLWPTGLLKDLVREHKSWLYDIMAFEGPDFASGTQEHLKDGFLSQYKASEDRIRFVRRMFNFEVSHDTMTKEELSDLLDRVSTALEVALKSGDRPSRLFFELMVKQPITHNALEVLEVTSKIQDTPEWNIHRAVLSIFTNQYDFGVCQILSLQHLVCLLDDNNDLRRAILKPCFIQGIERCISKCQFALCRQVESGSVWFDFMLKFHAFCVALKESQHCYLALSNDIRSQLNVLPPVELLRTLIEIQTSTGDDKHSPRTPELKLSSSEIKKSIREFCIDRMLGRETQRPESQRTVDAILEVWNNTKEDTATNTEKGALAILLLKIVGLDPSLRCKCLSTITTLPDELARNILEALQGYYTETQLIGHAELSCVILLHVIVLVGIEDPDISQC